MRKILTYTVLIFIGTVIGYNMRNKEVTDLKNTISRQGFAIQNLEKQKNEVDIPRYLDSIPDFD
jgi:hypothetical protein